MTASREELAEFEFDPRYQRLAAEAAENASRVIVADAALAAEVQSRFGDLEGRVAIVPGLPADPAQSLDDACVAELTNLYAAVLDERLGRLCSLNGRLTPIRGMAILGSMRCPVMGVATCPASGLIILSR